MATKRTWLARLLTGVGLACLGYYGYVAVSATTFQHAQWQRFEALRSSGATAQSRQPLPSAPRVELPASVRGPFAPLQAAAQEFETIDDGVVGLLEIPRLGIATPIVSGDDEKALEIAVGHLPDTPLPWETGNSAVAAHRDGLFRPLKDVRSGDRIVVRTTRGELEYQVRSTKVVRPTDLSVLEPLDADALTLITCYPFNYVGSAPRRFIVHAVRTVGPASGDDTVLPSRSLVTTTRYSAATDQRPHAAARETTGERRQAGVQRANASRARVVRAQKANAARTGARRTDASTAVRDGRGRTAATSDRDASATKGKKAKDDGPRKRRWYHIFTRG